MKLCVREQGGDLFDAITSSNKYTERDASGMLYNLASSIKYLHCLNIVHRDIKPENLLVGVRVLHREYCHYKWQYLSVTFTNAPWNKSQNWNVFFLLLSSTETLNNPSYTGFKTRSTQYWDYFTHLIRHNTVLKFLYFCNDTMKNTS